VNSNEHSAYDYAKDFWIPTVLGLGAIVSALWGKPGVLALGLTVATALAFIVVWARLRRRVNVQILSKEQQHVASHFSPRFQKFVHRFGEFVDSRTNNTLHYLVLNDLSGSVRDELCKRLGIAPIGLWNQFWFFFDQRIGRTQLTFTELIAGVEEFHHLLGEYNNLCVAPIFTYLPNEVRTALTEQQRSKLNGFQQRFMLYLRDYMAFAKELAHTSPKLDHLPRKLPCPDPL